MKRLMCAVLALVFLLAGCTGVPTSSEPQVVSSVLNVHPGGQVPSPAPGADQRSIVQGFLAANAAADGRHAAARAFLTSEAKNRWSDATVTVIDSAQISNPSAASQVTVRGRVIGTIDASGVYTPKLQGDGTGVGEAPVPFTFGLTRDKGEWRIDQLQNGLLIDEDQFQRYYKAQRSVYFYDLAEQHLVPDPRYTSLSDPQLLSSWLITQLAKQPRPQLQGAVSTELPAQTTPTVTMDATTVQVGVPGARQLDATTRNRLAGQIALTLDQVDPGKTFSITDSGKAVPIPAVGGTEFSARQFRQSLGTADTQEPRALFYIRQGAVWTSSGKPMHGPLGAQRSLHSIALADLSGSTNLRAAGTAGPKHERRLLIGTQREGLHRSGLVGDLSRPAWVPDLDEVWVGDGSRIFRVANGGKPTEVPATTGSGKIAGTVDALRFSPDGSRIAVVLTVSDDSAQLWVGAVVRNGKQVRVDNLQAISPAGVVVTDVAWNDDLKLFTIGTDKTTGLGDVFEVQCDGSLWSPKGTGNLPVPDSITVAKGQPAAVSSDGTLWVQSADTWVGLNNGKSTSGTHPIYVE